MVLQNIIYNNSPIFVQNILCTIRGYKEKKLRMSGAFWKYFDFLQESQWYSQDEIDNYQNDHLGNLINYVYNYVPYYKSVMTSMKLTPKDIKTKEDLMKLPILTKEDVRTNYNQLISTAHLNDSILKGHTSGSTGKSLNFLITKDAIRYRWAMWFRHKARFGIMPNDPYATFTGLPAIPLNQTKPPYWRENKALRQTVFTMHHITKDKTSSIVNRLNEGGFVYYSGYPSIIYSLACNIVECNLEIVNPPKVVFTGAETLLSTQKQLISTVFKARVTDQYGFSEGCGNASRCEENLFHEDFEYGILECLNPSFNNNEMTGDIIATGFTNMIMPLIRYKVGDIGTWIETSCACGRKSNTLKIIEGRNEDYVVTPEGCKVLRFDYIFKETKNILEAQVIQKNLGEIVIRIVKRNSYSIADEMKLRNEVYNKISPKLSVVFEYVNEIEREKNGKFRAVKSYLK